MHFRNLGNLLLRETIQKNHEKSRPNCEKNQSEIDLFFNIDFSRFWLHFGRFWEPLGPLLAGLGRPKCGPRGCPSLRESSFFSTFVVFVARLSVFFDLGGFGEGLGRVFGGLGKDFCQDFENFAIIFTLIFTTFIVFVARLC